MAQEDSPSESGAAQRFPPAAAALALGSTEEASRKRVARALERLKILLTRRKLALSTTALVSMLGHQAVASAPVGMATAVAGPALAASAMASSFTFTVLNFMAATKPKLGAITALIAVGVATPILIQHQVISREREANVLAQSELATLRRDNGALSNRLSLAGSAQSLSEEQKRELMKLRDQVGQLRAATNDLSLQLAQLRGSSGSPINRAKSSAPAAEAGLPFELNQYLPAEGWTDAGFNSHATAVQTFLWAGRLGNIQRWMEAIQVPAEQRPPVEARFKDAGPNAIPFSGAKGVKLFAVEERTPQSFKYVCDFDWGEDQPGKRIHFVTE